MRKTLLATAVLFWLAGVVAFLYWFWPREQQVMVARLVSEHMTKTKTVEIRIGDQTGTVQIPFEYQVNKPVYETIIRIPSREEQLRFFCLAGVAALVFLYGAIVIVSFGSCLWNRIAPAKVLEIQLTGMITFLMGIFGGAFALPTPPPQPLQDYTDSAMQPYSPSPTLTLPPSPTPTALPTLADPQ